MMVDLTVDVLVRASDGLSERGGRPKKIWSLGNRK
jgi:hypothetical protein